MAPRANTQEARAHTFSLSNIALRWQNIQSGGKKATVLQGVVDKIDASQVTAQLGFYFGEKLDHGATQFSVPAGVVAAIIGRPYETKEDKTDFQKKLLEADPVFNAHFTVYKKKKQMLDDVTEFASTVKEDGKLGFYIPGDKLPDEGVDAMFYTLDPKNDPKSANYCFITPQFGMHLVALHKEEFAFLLSVLDQHLSKGQVQGEVAATYQDAEDAENQSPVPSNDRVHPHQEYFDKQNAWVASNYQHFKMRKEMETFEYEKVKWLLSMQERELDLRSKQHALMEKLGTLTLEEKDMLRGRVLQSNAMTMLCNFRKSAK